jgi:hypothetical protein
LRLKQQNPDYTGFRGPDAVTAPPQPQLESVVCSVCRRKRNVPVNTLPDNRDSFVCLQYQEARSPAPLPALQNDLTLCLQVTIP